jgi:hypothetical protein
MCRHHNTTGSEPTWSRVENHAPAPSSHEEPSTQRSDDVKYMLLIYNNPEMLEAMPEAEMQAVMADVGKIMEELQESGEWIGGAALAHPSQTKTVRIRDGVPAVTDGPYSEAKEQFAGYCMLECESPERATEIGLRWPDARYAWVELRPVMDEAGTEM